MNTMMQDRPDSELLPLPSTPISDLPLSQLPIGAWGKVVQLAAATDRDFGRSGIAVGASLRLLSRSASGSAIVQLASGVQIGLNRELTQHIWLQVC